jgi:ectoine hydroxylase-related dioxygenase (phytanoyl-CoA dioxygenase family)
MGQIATGKRIRGVSDKEIQAFDEHGVILLRNVVSEEELRWLEEGIEHNLAHPGPLAGIASRDTDPGKFFEDFCNWDRIPQYKNFLFQSDLPRISAKLLRSRKIRLYHDHVLVKEANTKQPTPWHQDQPYYNITGNQTISFWIPIDPIPIEASLQFLAGSHKPGTWYMPRTFLTKEAKWFPEGSLPEVPVIDERDIVSWDLQPGDAIAFHMLTLHGSPGTAARRRRVVSARYVGDNVRHAPRSWKTSPEFPPSVKDTLPPNAELDHPLFPIVYKE